MMYGLRLIYAQFIGSLILLADTLFSFFLLLLGTDASNFNTSVADQQVGLVLFWSLLLRLKFFFYCFDTKENWTIMFPL